MSNRCPLNIDANQGTLKQSENYQVLILTTNSILMKKFSHYVKKQAIDLTQISRLQGIYEGQLVAGGQPPSATEIINT